jgi:hypothetical protein
MDVLDTGEALPNHLAVPGGFSVEVVEDAIRMVKDRFEVCAGAITSFDPSYDKDDQVLAVCRRETGGNTITDRTASDLADSPIFSAQSASPTP